jgi:hypothetical protein
VTRCPGASTARSHFTDPRAADASIVDIASAPFINAACMVIDGGRSLLHRD